MSVRNYEVGGERIVRSLVLVNQNLIKIYVTELGEIELRQILCE